MAIVKCVEVIVNLTRAGKTRGGCDQGGGKTVHGISPSGLKITGDRREQPDHQIPVNAKISFIVDDSR